MEILNLSSSGKLAPLHNTPTSYKIGAFDIETYGKYNTFYMGSTLTTKREHLDFNKDKELKVFYSRKEMLDYILEERFTRNYIWFATNLQFDLLGLINNDKRESDFRLLFRQSRLLYGKYYKKCTDKTRAIKFYDTFNHTPFSVETLGEIINIPKYEKPKFLGNIPKDNEEELILKEYNINDTLITYTYANWLQKVYNDLGTSVKITAPSSSMDLWRRKYQKENLYTPSRDVIDYLKRGYYGGRTETIKRGYIDKVRLYDINSLYPTVMSIYDYPNPNKFYYKNMENPSNLDNYYNVFNYDGVAEVLMYCPNNIHIPYLPVRYNNKLIFPTGYIRGYYTFFEIREAIKLGYEPIEIYSTITYTKNHQPFKDYVNDLYAKRVKAKLNHQPEEKLYKNFLNSLYGRFAIRISQEPDIRHLKSFSPEEFMKYWNDDDIDMDIVGNYVYMKKPSSSIPNYANPIYSIYVTAYARDYLYKSLPKDVYYMDTDSCITKKELDIGNGLGEWKLEKEIDEGIIVKPKFYMYDDVVKIKGCRRVDNESFKKILIGEKYKYNKISKFKEAIRRNLEYNEIIDVEKALDLEDNKRLWNNKFNHNILSESRPINLKLDDYEKVMEVIV